MKRADLTVGMDVAIKHGYGDGYRATVVSLDKHAKGYSGRTITGRGTGLLVEFTEGYKKGEQVVVQPQAVLGEWATYQAEKKAQQEAREASTAAQAERQRIAQQAEEAAVARGKEFGVKVDRSYKSYDKGRVSMTTAQFNALLDALPEGFTFPQAQA